MDGISASTAATHAKYSHSSCRPRTACRDLYGRRSDGSEFPVQVGLNPVETEEGMFVLSAIVDLTERKRMKLQLKNANAAREKGSAERIRRNAERKQFV